MENWFQFDSLVIEHYSNRLPTRYSFIKCIFCVLLLFVISFSIYKFSGVVIHFEVTTEENDISTETTSDGGPTVSSSTEFPTSQTSIGSSTAHWNPT